MIQELAQFTELLLADDPALLEKNLRPRDGLHLLLTLREDGSQEQIAYTYVEKGVEYDQPSGQKWEGEYSALMQTCLTYQLHSPWLDANKAMDTGKGGKKIHSASPFVVAFKKENLGIIHARYPIYFQAVRALQLTEEEEALRQQSELLEVFCRDHLMAWLTGLEVYKQGKKDKATIAIPFKELGDALYLNLYLADVSVDQLKQTHERYLTAKLFNTDDFNQVVEDPEGRELTYGVSNYLNGKNSKKPFLLHHSAPFHKKLSGRIEASQALRLYQFEQLLTRNRILPNPLPLFIYHEEINKEVVKIFRESEFKMGYQEIISHIFNKHGNELGNYYLFYFGRGKDVLDFDFVSAFKYTLGWSFTPVFSYKKEELPPAVRLGSRFALEQDLLPVIFENKLIVKNKEGQVVSRRYFNDLDGKSYGYPEANTFRLIAAYRQGWFDFMYKSREQAISGEMFGDMMLSGILEGLKRDEAYKNTYNIKQKANYWFGLNAYFDPENRNFNGISMASKIPELLAKAQTLKGRKREEGQPVSYLADDQEFAFMAGQVLYYLLSQSKAAQKTHALFHPFLLKTSTASFRAALQMAFTRYAYDISQSASVNRVLADLMAYETRMEISQLQPMIIAGYLADNVFYQKSSHQPSISEN